MLSVIGSKVDTTTQIEIWVAEYRNGNQKARDNLLRYIQNRLRLNVRRQIASYPKVEKAVGIDDVVQNVSIRIMKALDQRVELNDATHFFNFVGLNLRRELLDLARKYEKLEFSIDANEDPNNEPQTSTGDPQRLSKWSMLHDSIDKLSGTQKETFTMHFYLEIPQNEIAKSLGLNPQQVSYQLKLAKAAVRKAMEGWTLEL